MDDSFCQVCCTAHAEPAPCPGELRPTAPERHGWSALLDTPRGPQVCGVVLAPTSGPWRARIVTYPKFPWTIPGGRGPVRFSGDTSDEAESRAVAYVHALCAERGWRWSDTLPLRRAGDRAGVPERRKRRSIPVRIGTDLPSRLCSIVNLSEGGVYVADPEPWPPGTHLHLEVEVWGCVAPLQGVVAWTRCRIEPGRPRGMGIRLDEAPPLWITFVRGLP